MRDLMRQDGKVTLNIAACMTWCMSVPGSLLAHCDTVLVWPESMSHKSCLLSSAPAAHKHRVPARRWRPLHVKSIYWTAAICDVKMRSQTVITNLSKHWD